MRNVSTLVAAIVGIAAYAAIPVLILVVLFWAGHGKPQEPPPNWRARYELEHALVVGFQRMTQLLEDSIVKLHVRHNNQSMAPSCRWPVGAEVR